MKRITLILILLLAAMTASAQYNTSSELYLKRGHLYQNDNKLSVKEINSMFSSICNEDGVAYSEVWRKAGGMRTAGVVLTSVGSVAIVAGPVMTLFGTVLVLATGTAGALAGDAEAVQGEGLVYSGLAVGIAGVGMLGSGIPLLCVGNKRMKGAVSAYNSGRQTAETSVSLNLGACPNGFGLSLRF